MKKIAFIISCIVIILFGVTGRPDFVYGVASNSNTVTYDVANDMTAGKNPSGAWSYGWSKGIGQPFNLYDYGTKNYGFPLWICSQIKSSYNIPSVWKNTTGDSKWGINPGQLALHPGENGQVSAVRWKSPGNGSITVSGCFGAGDTGNESYYIYKNGTKEIFQKLNTNDDGSFSFSETVVPGDAIDFLVGLGNGDFYCGNVSLNAKINLTSTDSTQLPAPKGLKVQALNKNQVKMSWQPVAGAGSYSIYRTKVKTGTKVAIPAGLQTSMVDYVEPATTYYYAVAAISPGGKVGKWPKSLQITTPKISGKSLNPPKGLTLKALGKGKVQASWKPVAGAAAYKIYRCRKGDTYNSQPKWTFSQVIKGCSFIDTNQLAPKTGYYYAVAAINNYWEEGKWSQSREVTTPACNGKWLSAPKLYEIKTFGSNVVDIYWYSVNDAQKYRVYRCTKGDENKPSAQKWSYKVDVEGVTGFIDNQNLNLDNGYYYAIAAVNSYGEEGQWSPSYLVTTNLHISDTDISNSNSEFIIKQANDIKGLIESGASLSGYLTDEKPDISKCFNILDKALAADEIMKAANNDRVSAQRRWIDSADIILSSYQGWAWLDENTRKKDLMIFSNQFFRKDLQAAWEQAYKNYRDLYIGRALTRDQEKLAELKKIEEDLYQQLMFGY